MIKLKSLFELKKHPPTNDVVYVRSIKKLYKNDNGEWFEKAYYTVDEVADILSIPTSKAKHIIRKLGLKMRTTTTDNLNYDQLIVLVKVIGMRKENPYMKYLDIKKKLKL